MRVIGGQLRGRELKSPRGKKTRPTTDKVREAWFNILRDVSDAHVLELYAGTGALGIEALSRGARHVVFVEAWPPAQQALLDNLTRLGLKDSATLIAGRVESQQKRLRLAGPFDLVLADPPWTDLERCLRQIDSTLSGDLLSTGARVFVGHPSHVPAPELTQGQLECIDQRAWGDSGASLYVKPPQA